MFLESTRNFYNFLAQIRQTIDDSANFIFQQMPSMPKAFGVEDDSTDWGEIIGMMTSTVGVVVSQLDTTSRVTY
jgi:hypothetical protein